jgi:hypothetical protein
MLEPVAYIATSKRGKQRLVLADSAGHRNAELFGETLQPLTGELPEGFAILPIDLLTHIGDWEAACNIAFNVSTACNSTEGAAYWMKQLKTIENIRGLIRGKNNNEKI